MNDLTEGQKAIIADLAAHEAHQLLERGGYVRAEDLKKRGREAGLLSAADIARNGTDEAALIPDVNEARRIIEEWHKEQPRWWNVRRRADAMVGGIGLVGVLLLMGADWVQASLRESPSMLRTAVHQIADTDGRIDERLAANADAAAVPTPEGYAPAALGRAMRSHFDRWATADGFPAKVDEMLRKLAADPNQENPLNDFVAAAMKDRPLLVFHGSGSIGRSQMVLVENKGCVRLALHWRNTQQADPLLPEESREDSFEGLCEVTAHVPGSTDFTLPFYARFHLRDGRSDSVYVVLQVVSSNREGSDFGSRAGLRGLTVHSVSMNEALVDAGIDEVDLRGLFERHGSFFVARIDREVAKGTRDTSPGGEPAARELLHSLVIGLECMADSTGEADGQFGEGCDGGGAPQEHVTLRAFVIVNKDGL